jgi:DNA-binding CsgD family transcriptional regulator
MHSIDETGQICVNLNDFNELFDSIRFRHKIDYLVEKLECPKDISNFSVSIFFKNGQRYYISNLYLWAIPYRTEGFYRGDVDHDYSLYDGKEFFIQKDIKYDEMQIPIIQILESRYKLSTTFAMIRQCAECDFIIETYNKERVNDPEKLYYRVRNDFEQFIFKFLDAMQEEIITALPNHNWLTVLNDKEFRKKIITRQLEKQTAILSSRERQCLLFMSQGKSMKEIANSLYISDETVNTHAKAIRRKLNSKNITQAVMKAYSFGLL